MTAFKNTIAGKILKGVAIAGGSVLALGAIVGSGGAAAGPIATIAGGALSIGKKVIQTVGKVAKPVIATVDKVAVAGVNLVTGTTKAERKQVQAVKQEVKAAENKIQQVNRLTKAGAGLAEALATVGVSMAEYQGIEKAGSYSNVIDEAPVKAGMFDTPAVKYAAIGVGLLFLAKMLKIIK
jgi:hypothetical protein